MIKNMIEIYRIKGTNYSFELFFNFIGYEIKIVEYYFDKRFYLSSEQVNPYTLEADKFKFAKYLTPNDPTKVCPDGLDNPFGITKADMVPIRNGLTFDKDMELGSIVELERYLDINGTPDPGMDYTYFKTNVVEYSIKKTLAGDESGEITDDPNGLTQEDQKIISSYVNFLTPIYIAKRLIVKIKPFEDYAGTLIYYDKDLIINGILTSMFEIEYSGFFEDLLEDKLSSLQEGDWKYELEEDIYDLFEPSYEGLYDNTSFLSGFEYTIISNNPIHFTAESSSEDSFKSPSVYKDVLALELFKKGVFDGSGEVFMSGNAVYNIETQQTINSGASGTEVNGSSTF
jgi:hypothetical protein